MKTIFNRAMLLVSLILILMLSIGLVSATSDSEDLIDMTYDGSLINEDLEINDLSQNDMGSDNLDLGYESDDEVGFTSDNQEILSSEGGKDFKDIQDLIDQADENDTVTLSGTYTGDSCRPKSHGPAPGSRRSLHRASRRRERRRTSNRR